MQFFTETHIDFMRLRGIFVVASTLLTLLGLLYVGLGRLNIGIDFAGGTQLTLEFQQRPELDQLRSVLAEAGMGAAQIQRFGIAERNEVLIRTSTVDGSEEGTSEHLLNVLDRAYNSADASSGRLDLNRQGADALAGMLSQVNPESLELIEGEVPERYQQAAEAILELRRQEGLISTWDEVTALPEVTPAMAEALKTQSYLGTYSLLSVENVGPQIGSELRSKGIWAVLLSLAGMLVYIALRFELRFGIGAVVASIHDVAVTLGLFAILGFEFNVTTIAAFLTLVGYSVNDTVVVFDRVRENMRRVRREPLVDVLNRSLNQTLSRTLMTSFTTFVVVLMLLIFGGDTIRGFAFVLTIGIFVGTYSSIYVASPIVLVWERWFGRDVRAARRATVAR